MAGENTEVLMPLMGEGITEATLVKWLKKPGDKINKEEPLLEVSTDKVDTEIPSPAAGVLVATFAAEGETVPVNQVIAHIGTEAGAVVKGNTVGAKAKPSASPSLGASAVQTSAASEPPRRRGAEAPSTDEPAPAGVGDVASRNAANPPYSQGIAPGTGETRRSSPLVRKMARASGIDLTQVSGSGLHGRITKRDVETFLTNGVAGAARAPQATAASPSVAAAAPRAAGGPAHLEWGRVQTRSESGRELLEGVPVRREPMSKMRQLIAEHMVRSVRTSPHVTTIFEIDMHRVTKLRDKVKTAFAAREGFGLTFTAFFIHAAVQAIKKHPIVNVSIDGNDILWKDQINVGVAVAIETGLIVPVIKNAGELNLTGIARRLNDLATRARTKKLAPEDVQGGTFSITNPGMFGSIVSAPIINQPQVAILSIGQVVKRPVVIDDLIGIRPLVQVGLTFDHRVVDGEGGARYLATLKETLESYDESAL